MAIPKKDFFQAGDFRLNTPVTYDKLTALSELLQIPDDRKLEEGRSLLAYILTQEEPALCFKGENEMVWLAFWLVGIYIERRTVEG